MIRDITLTVNGRDFSGRLSTYKVTPELTYAAQLTSINGTEHHGAKRVRDTVSFTLFPADPSVILADRLVLESPILLVDYSDPGKFTQPMGVEMILETDLDSVFKLNSVDGQAYYTGGEITLRARRPR